MMMMRRKAVNKFSVIISAPSGAGKSTLISRIMKKIQDSLFRFQQQPDLRAKERRTELTIILKTVRILKK